MDGEAKDLVKPDVPEMFKPVFDLKNDSRAALGRPTGSTTAFFGFGEEDLALPMENGILVFRMRTNRFSAIPAEYERGFRIDVLTPPKIGSVEIREIWNVDAGKRMGAAGVGAAISLGDSENPIRRQEISRFAELAAGHAVVIPIVAELDWYRKHSETFFENRANELATELAKRTQALAEAERQLAESRESRLKNVGVIGVLKNVATSFGHEKLERQVRQAEQRISETREAMAANDNEATKHRRFSLDDAIARLVDAEDDFFRKYREFCIVRHFRERFETEIGGVRTQRNNLQTRVSELQAKNAKTAANISELETKLPELRALLGRDTESLREQERALVDAEQLATKLETDFRKSFEKLVGQPAAIEMTESHGQTPTIEKREAETDDASESESLSFRCPECNKTISFREDSDFYLVICPKCGTTIDLTELEPEN